MSGFKPYPAYKDSGLDWLPEVPAHWVDRKIARDIPFVVGWTPPSGKDEYYDGDLPWVTIADMTQMSVEDTKSKISLRAVQDKGAQIVPAGSMLFSFKLSVGKVAFLTIESYTNEAIAGFLPSGPLDLEYWKYAAPEFIPKYGRENIYGATLLNQELINAVRFFAPARLEQTQIARFLDHETARIDALIEEQQRLIELLKEKRQAVISHAVTKGLDPTVPMKDSGVEWLGKVPEHWKISKFGYISSVVRGGSPRPAGDPELFNGDYSPWVTVAEITKDDEIFLWETETFLTKKGSDQCRVFSSGTLLVSNSGATLGVPKILMINANANDGVVGFENISLDKEYSYFYLSTLTQGLRERAAGSGQPNLNTDIIKSIDVPIPPDNEVAEIVVAVKKLREQFHTLSKQAADGVRLLQERRSALISAAVTGKIDVRNWQPATTDKPVHEPMPMAAEEPACYKVSSEGLA